MGGGQQPSRYPSFFEQLGERCQQGEAVAMDMNTAFDLEVKQHCPQAGGLTCSTWWLAMAEVVDRVQEWSRRMH